MNISHSVNNPKVSVIVPVYNAESYLVRCIDSLLSQTLKDIELIFINDCSTDNSMDILSNIAHYENIRVLSTKRNSKQAKVRTIGIKTATGEFVANCDPDDWVEPNMYETMYNLAKASNSDIITCRIRHEFGNGRYSIQGPMPDGCGKDILKGGKISHSLCNKLISRELIMKHSIYPFPGINYGEDCNTIIRAAFYAKHISSTSEALYHYDQTNPTSITKHSCIWLLENYGYKNIALIEDFFRDNNAYPEMKSIIDELKYTYKAPLLYTACNDGAIWCEIFPEIHSEIRHMHLPKAFRLTLSAIANHPKLVKILSKYITRGSK